MIKVINMHAYVIRFYKITIKQKMLNHAYGK